MIKSSILIAVASMFFAGCSTMRSSYPPKTNQAIKAYYGCLETQSYKAVVDNMPRIKVDEFVKSSCADKKREVEKQIRIANSSEVIVNKYIDTLNESESYNIDKAYIRGVCKRAKLTEQKDMPKECIKE